MAATLAFAAGLLAAQAAACADSDWLAASSAFKLELHALAAEALMLQIEAPTVPPSQSSRSDRKLRADAHARLSRSLHTANAFLSMMEIAEHSDRGPRVREVLLLWLGSGRKGLEDDLRGSGRVPAGATPHALTAAYLEEIKALWQRLDRAYADLETSIRSGAPGSEVE